MTRITGAFKGSPTVEVHVYDPALPAVFNEVKSLIQEVLPGIQVEHIGSSSIPGVGGRNVIDMVIPAEPTEHPSILQHLYALGFQDSPFQYLRPMLIGSISYQSKDYPLLLYLMSPTSDIYQGWLLFRDYMKSHPEDAKAYEAVKRQAAAGGTGDQGSYMRAKTPFLQAMVEKIQQS